MNRKINLAITAIFLVLTSLTLVTAIGVSFPHPQNIELKPGESSYFSFQIQSDNSPLVCIPIIEEKDGLELAFNQEYKVEANQKYVVKPQVIVPEQTPFGSYEAKFCIECTPDIEGTGSKIVPRICGFPISVIVVSERTRTNMFEEAPAKIGLWIIIILIAAIIILLIIIIFFLMKRKEKAVFKQRR